jgi:hypothetical protein
MSKRKVNVADLLTVALLMAMLVAPAFMAVERSLFAL